MESGEPQDNQSFGYDELARRLYATGIVSDPWLNGRERFRLQPVILPATLAEELSVAAESIAAVYHELSQVVLDHPELLDQFFELTPWQKVMWLAAEGRWHGIARIDLFLCADGRIRSCEMNSDTPSGEAEAVVLNQLLRGESSALIDPNEGFDQRFWELLVASHQASSQEATTPKSVAILYPTDLPEDLSMIAIYQQWLEARECRVILGSPFNLGLGAHRRVTVMGAPVDLIIRHYKTDWWGEREAIWSNQQPFADPDPLDRELSLLLEAENERRVAVVNPFGAVLTQNKLSMALMWERQELFSTQSREWIQFYIPETRRLTSIDPHTLIQNEWVLKSDYGCEGDSVVVGPFVKPGDWQLALTAAIPRHWVAQRFFEVAPIADGALPNYGVYVMGGRTAGYYTRLSAKATDYTATTAATFVGIV
jgi:glutathionylspermidine synthase